MRRRALRMLVVGALAAAGCGDAGGNDASVPRDAASSRPDSAVTADGGSDAGSAPAACIAWEGVRTFGTGLHDEARTVVVDAHGTAWVGGFASGIDDSVIPVGDARALLVRVDAGGEMRTAMPLALSPPHSLERLRAAEDGRIAAAFRVRAGFAGDPVDPTRYDVAVGLLDADARVSPVFRTGVVADDLPTALALEGERVWVAGYAEVRVEDRAVVAWEDGFVAGYRAAGVTRVNMESDASDLVLAMDARAGTIAIGGVVAEGAAGGPFVSRLDEALGMVWTRQLSSVPFDAVTSVIVEDEGHVIAVGATSISFGGTSHGGQDVFVVRLDRDSGEVISVAQVGGVDVDFPTNAALAPDGTLVIAGETYGGVVTPALGAADVFALGILGDGTLAWVRELGTADDERVAGVAVDACGNVVVVGASLGPIGGAPSRGGRDGFVWAFDPARE